MDFKAALSEVYQEDGFWAHLTDSNGVTFSWKRYQEMPGGRWSDVVLDEGSFNARPMKLGQLLLPQLPWAVWLKRHGPALLVSSPGRASEDVQVFPPTGNAFSWQRMKVVGSSNERDVPVGDIYEACAYEANQKLPPEYPYYVTIVPRTIPGEYMFSIRHG